jgi:hypothetical protein
VHLRPLKVINTFPGKKTYNANINIKIDVFGAGMICIRTTPHLRFNPINKAAVIVAHNFTMLWYAPPDWVNRKAYTINNCEYTNCVIPK